MTTAFPTDLDALTNPGPTDFEDDAGVEHDVEHADANDAIEALEAKVGIDDSAVTTSLDYRVQALETGGAVGELPDLTDVNDAATSGASVDDVLTFDGSEWNAAAPTGGGGGLPDIYMPDVPPATPHANDDEFASGSLDGAWTEFDPGAVQTVTVGDYGLKIVQTGSGSFKAGGIVKAVPAGDFTVYARVALVATKANYTAIGLLLMQDVASPTTADLRTHALLFDGTSTIRMSDWSDYQNVTSDHGTTDWDASHAYLRIRRISSTYYFDVSSDGVSWQQHYTTASLGITPVDIGVFMHTSTSETVTGYVQFYRQLDTTDRDQPVMGQRGGTAAAGGDSMPALGRAAPEAAPAGGSDDEFIGDTLTGWTEVQRSGDTNAWTQRYDRLVYRHKDTAGGAGDLHSLLKAFSPSVGDYIETCFNFTRFDDYLGPALVMTDGTTENAGAQIVLWAHQPGGGTVRLRLQTLANFRTVSVDGTNVDMPNTGLIYARLKYSAANTWAAYFSGDGFEWKTLQTGYSRTLTPTHMGVAALHFSALAPVAASFSFHYFRYNPADEAA